MSEIKESQLPIGLQVSSFRGLDVSQNSILIPIDDAAFALGVDTKANAEDVAEQFAERDIALTESLALKSDITYVNQQLETKAAAIDYSSLEEQIVPGEFFVGKDGSRKQVYTRTFIVNMPITLFANENLGIFSSIISHGIHNILNVDGTRYYHKETIKTALNNWKENMWYIDVAITGEMIIGGRAPLNYVGDVINIMAAIKYTKL